MHDCNPTSIPVECRVKLSKHNKGERVDLTVFKSLVGSLCYLTFTRLDILYAIRLVSCYLETPITTHFKVEKRILCYLEGNLLKPDLANASVKWLGPELIDLIGWTGRSDQ
ncbi:hypothetical protein Pint_20470 [Pistacia integerrima]|uniref:Uncharacterized protein n=1 Tax=Pistacia integerrima TaxID=434235 RepID=A0ACC0XBM3_9ROSI|nr:hypothetical protein Pint_20470 [Pistacia integerrima]